MSADSSPAISRRVPDVTVAKRLPLRLEVTSFSGPIPVPVRTTTKPGDTGPVRLVAPLWTSAMVGSGADTASTTPMVGLPPLELIVIVAEYCPTARFAGLTLSVRVAGVVPLVGVTVSHGALETVIVNGSGAPLLES